MKSVVLYGSFTCERPCEIIHVGKAGTPLAIRTQVIEGADALTALNMAKPRSHEIVLNTMEMP